VIGPSIGPSFEAALAAPGGDELVPLDALA
jgi:hypothetical protein